MNDGKKPTLFWMKVKTDFFYNDAIDYLIDEEGEAEGGMIVLIYTLICLKTLNTNGYLVSEINGKYISFTNKKLARNLSYFSEETVSKAINKLIEVGLICIDEENGNKYIPVVPTLTEKSSASEEAAKKSNYRKSKSTQKNTSEFKSKLNKKVIEIKHLNNEIETVALNELRESSKNGEGKQTKKLLGALQNPVTNWDIVIPVNYAVCNDAYVDEYKNADKIFDLLTHVKNSFTSEIELTVAINSSSLENATKMWDIAEALVTGEGKVEIPKNIQSHTGYLSQCFRNTYK